MYVVEEQDSRRKSVSKSRRDDENPYLKLTIAMLFFRFLFFALAGDFTRALSSAYRLLSPGIPLMTLQRPRRLRKFFPTPNLNFFRWPRAAPEP